MQLQDNLELLTLMLKDSKKSSEIYHTSNYWEIYEKKLVPELQKLGLKDYRRRNSQLLTSFGATDQSYYSLGKINLHKNRLLYNRILKKIPFWFKFLSFLNLLLNNFFSIHSFYSTEDIDRLFFSYALSYGEKHGAKSINKFEASLFGNPEHIIKINKKVYTKSILDFYIRYAYNCKYINFNDIEIMVELGSGSGKQIEVIKKLHPDICFLLFDLAPQSYVCEQYLQSVFPGEVVSYRDTRMMNSLPNDCKGKIFIFGNWKFPILEKVKIDLFWNASSFQEMEPEIVANYLKFINTNAKAVYLHGKMSGKNVALKKGLPGVLTKTTMDDFKKGLENFTLRERSPTVSIRIRPEENTFWERTY